MRKRPAARRSSTAVTRPASPRSGAPSRMKHSTTAAAPNPTIVIPIMGIAPTAAYSTPPSTAGTSVLVWFTTFTTAIARRITSSPWERNICGSAACTVGVSIASSTASTTCITAIAARLKPAAEKIAAQTSTVTAESASSATMTVRRFVRSAITPPRGESRIVGRMLAVRMEANAAAEPVLSSTHMDMANRSIRLAKSDMPRPATSRRKSRVRRGSAAWLLCGWVVHSYAFVIVDSFLVIGHGHLYKPTVGLLL